MAMRLPPLELRPGDREELERRVRANTVEARIAERARLVLMAADGATNRDIGTAIGMHYNQVAVWRRRYAEFGLVGLEDGHAGPQSHQSHQAGHPGAGRGRRAAARSVVAERGRAVPAPCR